LRSSLAGYTSEKISEVKISEVAFQLKTDSPKNQKSRYYDRSIDELA
jgi:hypothetical protein